jgi:hypothetical protein
MPLHRKGSVFDAVLRRNGTAHPCGSAWLDLPGEDQGVARLSRAVGLPSGVPDILGLALRFGDPGGPRHDLLLASTGLGPVTRFMLQPRQDPLDTTYSCLLPYAGPGGPLVLAAAPAVTPRRKAEGSPGAARGRRLTFHMLVAALRGRWQEFGRLELTVRAGGEPDPPLRFDPILNPLPDLGWYPALVRLREPAYAAARWLGSKGARRVGPKGLHTGRAEETATKFGGDRR